MSKAGRTIVESDCIAMDATLDDVVDSLANPEEYVRTVLSNLSICRRTHGNASAKIEIGGGRKIPAHQVVYAGTDGSTHVFGAFEEDGRLPDGALLARWSTAAMNFKEVQLLLGRLRSFDRRKTPRG